jgi:hypothetical protein
MRGKAHGAGNRNLRDQRQPPCVGDERIRDSNRPWAFTEGIPTGEGAKTSGIETDATFDVEINPRFGHD